MPIPVCLKSWPNPIGKAKWSCQSGAAEGERERNSLAQGGQRFIKSAREEGRDLGRADFHSQVGVLVEIPKLNTNPNNGPKISLAGVEACQGWGRNSSQTPPPILHPPKPEADLSALLRKI